MLSYNGPSVVMLDDIRASSVIFINLNAHICYVTPAEVHNRTLDKIPLANSPEWLQPFLPLHLELQVAVVFIFRALPQCLIHFYPSIDRLLS